MQTKSLHQFKSIKLFCFINLFCEIISGTERKNHKRGFGMCKPICRFMHSTISAAGNNNAFLTVFSCIIRCNFLCMTFIMCFFNYHLRICIPSERRLNLLEKKLFGFITRNRVFYKNIFHCFFS